MIWFFLGGVFLGIFLATAGWAACLSNLLGDWPDRNDLD